MASVLEKISNATKLTRANTSMITHDEVDSDDAREVELLTRPKENNGSTKPCMRSNLSTTNYVTLVEELKSDGAMTRSEGVKHRDELKAEILESRSVGHDTVSRLMKLHDMMQLHVKVVESQQERTDVEHRSLKFQLNTIERDQKTSEIMGVILGLLLGALLIADAGPSDEVEKALLISTGICFVVIFATVLAIDVLFPVCIYRFVVYRTVHALHMHVQVAVATFAGFWTQDRDFGILLLGVALCQVISVIIRELTVRWTCKKCGKTEIQAVFNHISTPNIHGHERLFANFLAEAAGIALLRQLSEPSVAELTDMLERARVKLLPTLRTRTEQEKRDWRRFDGHEKWDDKKTLKVMKFAFQFLKTGRIEEQS